MSEFRIKLGLKMFSSRNILCRKQILNTHTRGCFFMLKI